MSIKVDDKIRVSWNSNSIENAEIYLIGDALKKLLGSQRSSSETVNFKEFTVTKEWFNSQSTPVKIRVASADNDSVYQDSPSFIVYPAPPIPPGPSPVGKPKDTRVDNIKIASADWLYPKTDELKVIWVDNSTGETNFAIERKDESTDWATLTENIPQSANTGAPRSYTDKNLQANTLYTYRILAKTKDIFGDTSEEVSGSTGAEPIQALTIVNTSAGVKLTWQYSGIAKAFGVDRFDTAWSTLKSDISPDVREFTDTTHQPLTAYEYRIYVITDAGKSAATHNTITTLYAIQGVTITKISEYSSTIQVGEMPAGSGIKVQIDNPNKNGTQKIKLTVKENGAVIKSGEYSPTANPKVIYLAIATDLPGRYSYTYEVQAIDSTNNLLSNISSSTYTPTTYNSSLEKIYNGKSVYKARNPEYKNIAYYEYKRIYAVSSEWKKWRWTSDAHPEVKNNILEFDVGASGITIADVNNSGMFESKIFAPMYINGKVIKKFVPGDFVNGQIELDPYADGISLSQFEWTKNDKNYTVGQINMFVCVYAYASDDLPNLPTGQYTSVLQYY